MVGTSGSSDEDEDKRRDSRSPRELPNRICKLQMTASSVFTSHMYIYLWIDRDDQSHHMHLDLILE